MAMSFYNGKKCRYGKLKNPTKRRTCRKRPKRGSAKKHCAKGVVKSGPRKGQCKLVRRHGGKPRTKAAQEAFLWRQYRAGKL